MYDIHCHVLCGIDDGASNLGDSLEICRASYNDGIKTIIATPHYIDGESEADKSKILGQVLLLNQELKNEGINLIVLPGMEIFLTSNLHELYNAGKIMGLNCKNYMLIELPLYNGLPSCLEDVIFNLQLIGIKPVIAHPERCSTIMEHPNLVYKLIERECIIQVNAGSFLGYYGKHAEKTAMTLMEHNMVHTIGSDSHSSNGRMHSMKKCRDVVSKKFGDARAEDLFVNNGYRVIHGEKIDAGEPVMVKKKRFWIV